MKQYSVAERSPDTRWDDVEKMSVSEQPWFFVPDISMDVQILWDEQKLYIHQIAEEKNIRSKYTTHLSHVCDDSCMEFFIAPVEGDSRYFNFELNPNGALMLGFGRGRFDRIALLPKKPTDMFNIRTCVGEDRWEAFFEIPVSFFESFFPGFSFYNGMTMMVNCYKCGDKTDHVHYLTWSEMTSEKPDYHRYCDFGQITLVKTQ